MESIYSFAKKLRKKTNVVRQEEADEIIDIMKKWLLDDDVKHLSDYLDRILNYGEGCIRELAEYFIISGQINKRHNLLEIKFNFKEDYIGKISNFQNIALYKLVQWDENNNGNINANANIYNKVRISPLGKKTNCLPLIGNPGDILFCLVKNGFDLQKKLITTLNNSNFIWPENVGIYEKYLINQKTKKINKSKLSKI